MQKTTVYPFPFGQLKIGYENSTVTLLKKTDEPVCVEGRNSLTELVYGQVMEYLNGKRKTFDLPYVLRGTAFQQKVWQALLDIPYGETRTYGELAASIGNPKAARAVGAANNKNPITIVVPCHRVIGANGKLVGYAGGLHMKEALLQLEKQGGIL